MRRSAARLAALAGIAACWPGAAMAGAPITLRQGGPVVLPGSAVKAVVAEFVDPDRTELGRPVALALGGELLDAVATLPRVGVLVGTDAAHEGIVKRLGTGYHRAAVEIAREQGAIAALWGTIEASGDAIALESFVSQVRDTSLGGLQVHLEWEGQPIPGFRATIAPRSFRFAPRPFSRAALFRRPLAVIRGQRSVRSLPDRAAPVVAVVGPGDDLRATDLRDGWWELTLKDGRTGWMEHEENDVRVPPPRVQATGAKLPVFDAPGAAKPRGKRTFRGTYEVVAARYLVTGTWFRVPIAPIGVAGEQGDADTVWVAAAAFEPVYTLPSVRFLAAIYRYRLGRFDEAARGFHAFIDAAGPDEDNVTLSAAYQLAGLSRLQAIPDDHGALDDLTRSIELTPFDARARAMRALTAITLAHQVPKSATDDLAEALRLDPRDPTARDLVDAMQKLLTPADDAARVTPLERTVQGREKEVRLLRSMSEAYPDSTYGPVSK